MSDSRKNAIHLLASVILFAGQGLSRDEPDQDQRKVLVLQLLSAVRSALGVLGVDTLEFSEALVDVTREAVGFLPGDDQRARELLDRMRAEEAAK